MAHGQIRSCCSGGARCRSGQPGRRKLKPFEKGVHALKSILAYRIYHLSHRQILGSLRPEGEAPADDYLIGVDHRHLEAVALAVLGSELKEVTQPAVVWGELHRLVGQLDKAKRDSCLLDEHRLQSINSVG